GILALFFELNSLPIDSLYRKAFMKVPFIDLKTQYEALKPSINKRIQTVLDHGAYVNGPEIIELEKKLSEYTGAPYALTCSNGTDALIIPLMALGIQPGDEVITTAFSFIATAEAIALMGAKTVYVDIDPTTYNIDVRQIESKINKKTKAIMPVSLYGHPADMEEINALALKYNLSVIEDAAQSFGASFKGKKSCNLSLVAGTSFFPAKPLGCYGDGGAIFTQSEPLYKAMKEIREHGSESRYYHTRLGINGRLDTLQCAILLSKLERYEWEVARRQEVAFKYNEAFSQIKSEGFKYPQEKKDCKSVWAQYTIEVQNRDIFQKSMQELGVPTSVHYPRIMPDQPWYKEHTPTSEPLMTARTCAQHVISLPLYPDMTTEHQNHVIESVLKSVNK
ncbi:MAG TPA: DegT/DnrJ/EryC1/StrS family aminotransferase, partial [Pseudobdellovibrionaceae bacterium]|nr:DegT/DnrJ/EryC1/StrS family aminotransferase [Pseudobdellovibrionaceae bacterium]